MSKIIIGIDPDSNKNGVSVYENGNLIELKSLSTIDLFIFAMEYKGYVDKFGFSVEVHIEDLCAVSNSQFHWKRNDIPAVKAKKSEGVGRCKQAQIEAERIFEHFGIKIFNHKISKLWKSQSSKKQFEKVTGWKKPSNEDTRSAAYFGWLGCK